MANPIFFHSYRGVHRILSWCHRGDRLHYWSRWYPHLQRSQGCRCLLDLCCRCLLYLSLSRFRSHTYMYMYEYVYTYMHAYTYTHINTRICPYAFTWCLMISTMAYRVALHARAISRVCLTCSSPLSTPASWTTSGLTSLIWQREPSSFIAHVSFYSMIDLIIMSSILFC